LLCLGFFVTDETNEIILDGIDAVLVQKGCGRTNHYAEIRELTWPPPIKLGKSSLWPRHESQLLLRAKVAGASDDELRALVRALLEQRARLMPRLDALSVAAANIALAPRFRHGALPQPIRPKTARRATRPKRTARRAARARAST